MSLAKQNFASQSEEALNQQVNTELQASQVYLSMAAWAQHSSVALPGKDYYTLHRIFFSLIDLTFYIKNRFGKVLS